MYTGACDASDNRDVALVDLNAYNNKHIAWDYVRYEVVPEPTTMLLLCLAGMAGALRRRRAGA